MSEPVSLAEAAEALGYSLKTLQTYLSRDRDAWPRPVGVRAVGRARVHLYDLDALRAKVRPAGKVERPTGRPFQGSATVSDEDGLLTCLECGRRARNLEPHLRHAHGVTAAEYRAARRLPATAAMTSDDVREAARVARVEMLASDPDALAHLTPYHGSEWATQISRSASEAREQSREYEVVREHRLPGQRYAVARMVEQRLAKLDAAAVAAGYRDVADAIEQTLALSAAAAAKRIGISPQTVTRRRVAREGQGDGSQPGGASA